MELMAKEVVLTCVIRKERAGYSSLCPELNVASQGKTSDEARRNLREAVELFLQTAKEDNELDEILKEQKLKKPRILKLAVPLPA